ncbi:MAG: hypothetical protein DA405_08020 [Bacteroidetes bacterium]|nr:MAG: hypothetical protein DA405_08020 [Bacteroidota bacterium]
MKTSKVILSSLLASTILLSCSQAPTEAENATENAFTKVEQEEEAVEEETHQLSLNEGEKWQANPETTEGVNNIVSLVAGFEESEEITQYQKLQDKAKAEFNLIFKRCTMKGEAHNQLHHFLIPIKGSLDILAGDDLDASQKAFVKLKEHLRLYNEYFV